MTHCTSLSSFPTTALKQARHPEAHGNIRRGDIQPFRQLRVRNPASTAYPSSHSSGFHLRNGRAKQQQQQQPGATSIVRSSKRGEGFAGGEGVLKRPFPRLAESEDAVGSKVRLPLLEVHKKCARHHDFAVVKRLNLLELERGKWPVKMTIGSVDVRSLKTGEGLAGRGLEYTESSVSSHSWRRGRCWQQGKVHVWTFQREK